MTQSQAQLISDKGQQKPAAVELHGVSYEYAGAGLESSSSVVALSNINIRVEQGERLGILGPNGGGKSTLLKIIMGLLPAKSGQVMVLGTTPAQARAKGLIGYVAQTTDAELAFPLSVRQVLELARGWKRSPLFRMRKGDKQSVQDALNLVGAGHLADRPIGRLSGGQLQRVLIARALVTDPKLLILDEPTVGVDAAGQQQFADLLDRIASLTGMTMIIVSHDIRAIAAGSSRVACLSRTIHFHDSPSGLTPAVLAELFSHDIAGLIGSGPLAGMHLHAHGPLESCPVGLTVSSNAKRADRQGGP